MNWWAVNKERTKWVSMTSLRDRVVEKLPMTIEQTLPGLSSFPSEGIRPPDIGPLRGPFFYCTKKVLRGVENPKHYLLSEALNSPRIITVKEIISH